MLVGRTIVALRRMTNAEYDHEGWDSSNYPMSDPIVLILDDGTKIYPSRDPEGNGPGHLFGTTSDGESFHVMREAEADEQIAREAELHTTLAEIDSKTAV